jgi:hypothetical protein
LSWKAEVLVENTRQIGGTAKEQVSDGPASPAALAFAKDFRRRKSFGVISQRDTSRDWVTSFVMRAPVAEVAHAAPPGPVTAGLQLRSHQQLDLIRRDAIKRADLFEADMVAQRHFNDFAD